MSPSLRTISSCSSCSGIADQIALHRERVFHEARGMEGADGLVPATPGSHHLAAARPAGHEMRLDKAGGDAQIRFDEAAVDSDRRAARGGDAEIDMVASRGRSGSRP